jgi:predicted Ser/Thr protein kinase
MASVDLRTGSRLLDYRLEAVLGRGGMSVVYLAEDLRLRRKVALKLLTPELGEDDDFRERFVRESELAASIDHPNVIPIYEAGEADGRLYIAMRYVAGTDLKALLRREGAIDPTRAVAIVAQVATALDAAHEHGLVHRDVKPSNVLVTSQEGHDHVYLSDFGVAKSASPATGLTTAGQLFGTIDYVAPEQIRAEAVDGRTDQYSLGCLLFECLTGDVPYRRNSEAAAIFAHLRDRPPPVSDRLRGVPGGLDAVLARALAKKPRDRYGTCRELAAAAQAALETSKRRAVKPGRRTLVGAAGAAGLALGFALALGGGGSAPLSAADSVSPLTGTYETRISGTGPLYMGVTGTWRVRILADGAMSVMQNGLTVVVRGRASVAGAQVRFDGGTGVQACSGTAATGVYRWALRGGRLTFAPLRDDCIGRRIVLLAHPWAKVD